MGNLVTLPRVMLVGSGSGCGKTTLACAILRALQQSGHNPAAFKCGPDYIDPMFHSRVLGMDSCNLDVVLCGVGTVPFLLAKNGNGHGLALIEGVMGLYDGQGTSDYGSSNHLAMTTNTPEVLVISPHGQSLTLVAQLSGYLAFAPNSIKGVIFNKCSDAMYLFYKEMVENHLGLKVYGHLPPLPDAAFASRHLGLVTPAEIKDIQAKVDVLARVCAVSIDLEGLVALACSASPLEYTEPPASKTVGGGVRIAIAKDRAFCFYYKENFEVLRELGADLVFFSPLGDACLPEGVSGLVLGGGYPEEYAADLEANAAMRQNIRQAVEGGMPVFAECGGFLYLCRSLEGSNGLTCAMSGVIDTAARMTSRLGPFGYVALTAEQDTFLCPRGTQYTAHEFHYSTTDDNGSTFMARKANGKSWPCQHASGPEERRKIFAGYPHFHFRGNMGLAEAFVEACHEHREK